MLKLENWFLETHDSGIVLNLGCGTDTKEESIIHADKIKFKGVNILLDLDCPLPFKSNSIDEIYLERVMGHVKHPIKLRKEINRILKYGGNLHCEACGCGDVNPRFNNDNSYTKLAGTEKEIIEIMRLQGIEVEDL